MSIKFISIINQVRIDQKKLSKQHVVLNFNIKQRMLHFNTADEKALETCKNILEEFFSHISFEYIDVEKDKGLKIFDELKSNRLIQYEKRINITGTSKIVVSYTLAIRMFLSQNRDNLFALEDFIRNKFIKEMQIGRPGI
jgi:hypothetical protein